MLNDADTALSVMKDAVPALRSGQVWAQMGTVGVADLPALAGFAAEHGLTFVDSPSRAPSSPPSRASW